MSQYESYLLRCYVIWFILYRSPYNHELQSDSDESGSEVSTSSLRIAPKTDLPLPEIFDGISLDDNHHGDSSDDMMTHSDDSSRSEPDEEPEYNQQVKFTFDYQIALGSDSIT